MDYYVYLHIKSKNGVPFYVGKGRGKRSEIHSHRSMEWNKVSKLGYDILIIENNLSQDNAFLLEKYWVNRIGRDKLVNKTDGGGATFGLIHTEESKRKMSASRIGLPTSEKQKKIVGSLFKGKTGINHNRSQSVICVESGIIYGSQSEAQRMLNLGNGAVSWSIKHKKPIYGCILK